MTVVKSSVGRRVKLSIHHFPAEVKLAYQITTEQDVMDFVESKTDAEYWKRRYDRQMTTNLP